MCATRGDRPRAEAYVSPPRAWREQGERAHRQTAVHPCHRPQRPHPTPPGERVRSGSYHHADECGDSRWPSRLRRFLSGREFSVQALSVFSAEAPSKLSAETAEASRLLSGRLRAGAAAGRTSTESSSRPAFPSGPATSRRLCFVIGHCVRATVGSSNSTQCGSNAATLPILPHTGGSGPSGSGLFSIPTNAGTLLLWRPQLLTLLKVITRLPRRSHGVDCAAVGAMVASVRERGDSSPELDVPIADAAARVEPVRGNPVPWLRPDRCARQHAPHAAPDDHGGRRAR